MTYEEALREWGWRMINDSWKKEHWHIKKDDVADVVITPEYGGYCDTCEYVTLGFTVTFRGIRLEYSAFYGDGELSFAGVVRELAAIAAGE